MLRTFLILALAPCLVSASASARADDLEPEGTFSIVARDPATGELGLGVQSKAFAAGNRVITIKGGLVSIAHQATVSLMYGVLGAELLRAGMTPQQALDRLVRADEDRDRRQVAMIDSQGRTAAWTGGGATDWKGHRCGVDYCVQGNILSGPEVVAAMARAFESASGPLAERMLAALDAGQAAGGDARGMQSAALVVASRVREWEARSDHLIDLRVDDHRTPLAELRRLLDLFRSGQLLSEATAKLGAGDDTAALQLATAARDKSPGNDNAWVALARIHVVAGRRKEALEAVARAVELNSVNARQLARNPAFEPLHKDPEFLRVVGGAIR